jgi:hypothetical protein
MARLLLPAICVALIAAGCGSQKEAPAAKAPAPGTYVARIPGTQAYLAVVVDGKEVGAYLCDSNGTAAWFAHKSHDDGAASLVSRSGKATLDLKPAGDGLRGRVRMPDGSAHEVALERATGRAGLYRAIAKTRDGVLEGGWIVLADQTQRGALNESIGMNIPSRTTGAPPLDTATGTVKWALPTNPSQITQPGLMGSSVDL